MKRLFIIWVFLTIMITNPNFANTNASNSVIESNKGISLVKQTENSIILRFSVPDYKFSKVIQDGVELDQISVLGSFLPNNPGKPDLPSLSSMIAIPMDAKVILNYSEIEVETFNDFEVVSASKIPLQIESTPATFEKDELLYSKNEFYPYNFANLSEKSKIRGTQVVNLIVNPFRYNPVSKELLLVKEAEIEISFESNNDVSSGRLRNPMWDQMKRQLILNFDEIPFSVSNKSLLNNQGYDYLIICPDNDSFKNWADSIKVFRSQQGIKTGVVTTTDLGGNTVDKIEQYIDNAYNNWETPPAAILLLGDHGDDDMTVISPTVAHPYAGQCISDNKYADVDGDALPDIVISRITARNESELEKMISKVIDYEQNPPINENFYNHPITISGWEDYSWFGICGETQTGFFNNELGKEVVRINKIHEGNPYGAEWSTVIGTDVLVDYFGPEGTGYIPQSPAGLNWTGGNAAQISAAINSGAFVTLYDDHGNIDSWGCPYFSITDVNNLTNEDPTFVFSLGCSTGKFDFASQCFAEAFHRHETGALGIIASTELAYKLVNEVYHWGTLDYMWPQFMPDYNGGGEVGNALPAFASVYGKYFLASSNWPYNYYEKEPTYNVFHHHGDAYSVIFTEMPQPLTVVHEPEILEGVGYFYVNADEGSKICLSLNNEILAVASGSGENVLMEIPPQVEGTNVLVTVTKQNHYRYSSYVSVVKAEDPHVAFQNFSVLDVNGNNNGLLDYAESLNLSITIKNVGGQDANNVNGVLSCENEFVTIVQSQGSFGNIAADTEAVSNDFELQIANNIPDLENLIFKLILADGIAEWDSYFTIKAHAPYLQYVNYSIDDSDGNNNNRIDVGETVQLTITIQNTGSAEAYELNTELFAPSDYSIIEDSPLPIENLEPLSQISYTTSLSASQDAPQGFMDDIHIVVDGLYDVGMTKIISIPIGRIPVLILDLDGNTNSGSHMASALNDLGFEYDHFYEFPEDLKRYKSIFLCLGIVDYAHNLTFAQGDILSEFLSNGGSLYMEGGETWYFNEPTSVHEYFNIDGVSDGSGNLNIVTGQDGTFTEGMAFDYNGDNSWIDQLQALSSAFTFFINSAPQYGTGIAYDGGTYKTIGTSHEFGGLTDASSPSTKSELMYEYLNFMGVLETLQAAFSADATTVCEYDMVMFTDISAGEIDSWEWSFEGCEPSTSNDQHTVTSWDEPGTYDVSLTVTSGTETNTLIKEDYITVDNCLNVTINDNKPSVKVYPNPVSDVVYLNFKNLNGSIEISVTDILNKEVMRLNNFVPESGILPIHLNGISDGVYIINIKTADKQLTTKVVIRD